MASRRSTAAWPLAVVWPLALIAWLYKYTAHLGFNILDEGLVDTYGRRMLDGQVPHLDFISPRPVGSSIFHLVDFLVPLPLYLAGRLVGITSVVAYSILIAWLIFQAPPWRWGVVQSAAAASSALINLHTFIETPWYTFDGLLLSSAGFLLLDAAFRRRSLKLGVAALLIAGLAVTTKQSFAPAAVVMVVWVVFGTRTVAPARRRLALGAGAALVVALPMLLYLAVIALAGGGTAAVEQMTSGRLVWGRSLFELIGLISGPAYGRAPYSGHFPWEVGLAAFAFVIGRRRGWPAWVSTALAAAVVLLVLRLCLDEDLARNGPWSIEVMWAYILVMAAMLAGARQVPRFAWLVLLLAWMAMLSWGYDVPALVAGSMTLAIGAWSFGRVEVAGQLRPLAALAMVAVFVFVAARELDARRATPYFDQPAAALKYSVSRFSPDFRGIRTSAPVLSYLRGLAACRRRFPAYWTAVLPDNPGLYMTMKMHNPFPLDWFFRQDFEGQQGRILAAARKLEAEGNYLVLFQTVSGFYLSEYGRVPTATRASRAVMLTPVAIYDAKLGRRLVATLTGRHVVCGSFLGIYAPARR